MKKQETFFQTITKAVNYYIDEGWDSQKSLLMWSKRLRLAAMRENKNADDVTKHLKSIYQRLVIDGGALRDQPKKYVNGVTLKKVKPALKAELDRRIAVSANLIKLNREQAINKTIQRFEGWVSSLPPGGSLITDKVMEKKSIRQSLLQQDYVSRRLAIDQGHKLASNINYVLSIQGGAIAFIWHSRWRTPGYDYRIDHKERDTLIYLVRDSWAVEQGFIKPVNGYYDEITAAGEEVYCSCNIRPIYAPQQLPIEFLTEKGRREFERN